MNKYVVKFTKSGYIKYTSHLDILRLFKRSFKKIGINLEHSQGFNPHPKMSFGQPLSLGYSSTYELIEFETKEKFTNEMIIEALSKVMPKGVTILSCKEFIEETKPLAAMATEAEYIVTFPVENDVAKYEQTVFDYLAQDKIMAEKRKKKSKKLEPLDIKNKIRRIQLIDEGENLSLKLLLDCGSVSNLSPELVIATFCTFADFKCERYDIEVERTKLSFVNNLQF